MTILELLDAFGLPWFRQGSAPHELPETFVTEWQFDADLLLRYDNDAGGRFSIYSICIYTSDPSRLHALDDLCDMARRNGFTIRKEPRDIASGVDRYYGRQCEIYDVIFNKNNGDASPKE